MRTIQISDEDYEFLADLQHELNTQENDGQADPIYWSVMDHTTQPMPDGCGDPHIYMGDGCVMTTEEAVRYVDENICDYREELQEKWKDVDKNRMDSVVSFIYDDMEIRECRVVWLEEKEYISHESGAFITKRACKEYIQRFGYNHCKPHTYAMTAYRNFELERLLKILKTMEVKEVSADDHQENHPVWTDEVEQRIREKLKADYMQANNLINFASRADHPIDEGLIKEAESADSMIKFIKKELGL